MIFVCANCASFSPQPPIFNSARITYFLYAYGVSTSRGCFWYLQLQHHLLKQNLSIAVDTKLNKINNCLKLRQKTNYCCCFTSILPLCAFSRLTQMFSLYWVVWKHLAKYSTLNIFRKIMTLCVKNVCIWSFPSPYFSTFGPQKLRIWTLFI